MWHPVKTHVPPAATPPAVWCRRDGASSSLHAPLSCPRCPHPKPALGGVPRMPSSTTGWGGGRVGHTSGTQRIPSPGTSEVTWYQEGATRDWKPSPLPYQTRNVLYVFRGGTGVCSSLRNFNCVLNPPPSLHEGGTCLEHFWTRRSEQPRLCVMVTH